MVSASPRRTLVFGLGVSENCLSSKTICSRVKRALGKSSGSAVTISSPVELVLQAEPRRDRDKGGGEDGNTQVEEEVASYVGNRDEGADEDNDEAKRHAFSWW